MNPIIHPIRCASSHVMSALLTWRNPEGRDMGRVQIIVNPVKHIAKAAVTEAALAMLAVAAAVETAVYTYFFLL